MFNTSRHTCNLCLVLLALLLSIAVIVFAVLYSMNLGDSRPTNSTGSRVSQTLKFLVVVSRHGNRRSLTSLPNDTTHWNYGLGELTSNGHIQAYKLGGKIRSLYNGFLSTEYRSSDILASSTVLDRTMMSGELFLAGLYPPTGYQVWNSELLWQPIPLYSNSPDKSSLARHICPKWAEESAVSLQQFGHDHADNISSINSYLSEHLEFNVSGISAMFSIWDILFCEEQEGFPLPDWVKTVYPLPIEDLIGGAFIAYTSGTPSITRLSIGTFFREVGSVLMSKMNGSLSPDRRLHYYSGHDTTIVSLQALLGVPKDSVIGLVRPSSALIFELHQTPENKFYVEVLYLDGASSVANPKLIALPECGTPCELNTLVNITQQYTNISDYEQECQTKTKLSE